MTTLKFTDYELDFYSNVDGSGELKVKTLNGVYATVILKDKLDIKYSAISAFVSNTLDSPVVYYSMPLRNILAILAQTESIKINEEDEYYKVTLNTELVINVDNGCCIMKISVRDTSSVINIFLEKEERQLNNEFLLNEIMKISSRLSRIEDAIAHIPQSLNDYNNNKIWREAKRCAEAALPWNKSFS